MTEVHFLTAVLLAFQILLNVRGEILVQIGVSKPVNLIDDHYIGYSLDPQYLLDNYDKFSSKNFTKVVNLLGPTYVKLEGPSLSIRQNQSNTNLYAFNWGEVFNWISNIGRTAVIALPYAPNYWHPSIMDILVSATQNASLQNAIWQLGSDFNEVDADIYSNDLKSLRTIVNAFSKDYDVQWDVVSASLSAGSCPVETDKYAELIKYVVKAVGWSQTNTPSRENRIDPALNTLFRHGIPVWLTAPSHMFKDYDTCTNQCIMNGLRWAQLLGDAAQSGFNTIIKPMTYREFDTSNFVHYINKVHKTLIGVKVFATKVTNARDPLDLHLYAHCGRNVSGSFVIMAVNQAAVTQKVSTKMPVKQTGQEISQYILTVADGVVHLNDEPMSADTTLQPYIQIKRPTRFVNFNLPPLSVGFYMFPMAEVRECYGDFFDLNKSIEQRFADSRVGQLLVEAISKNQDGRNRRHLAEASECKRAKRFTLETSSVSKSGKLSRRFGSKMFKGKGHGKIRPKRHIRPHSAHILQKQRQRLPNAKRYRLNNNPLVSTSSFLPTETRAITENDNSNFPTSDVHFKIANPTKSKVKTNLDYDYIEFDNIDCQKKDIDSSKYIKSTESSEEDQVGSTTKIADTIFEFAPRLGIQSYKGWHPYESHSSKGSFKYPKNKKTRIQTDNGYKIKGSLNKNIAKYYPVSQTGRMYLDEVDDYNTEYITGYGHHFPTSVSFGRRKRHTDGSEVIYDDYELYGDPVNDFYSDIAGETETPSSDYSGDIERDIEQQSRTRRGAFPNRRTLNKTRRYPRGRYLSRLSRRRSKRNALYESIGKIVSPNRHNYIKFDTSHEFDSNFNNLLPEMDISLDNKNTLDSRLFENNKPTSGLWTDTKLPSNKHGPSESSEFVKAVTETVNYFVDIITKHVTGWWDMFSSS